jgi:hypothetical protein
VRAWSVGFGLYVSGGCLRPYTILPVLRERKQAPEMAVASTHPCMTGGAYNVLAYVIVIQRTLCRAGTGASITRSRHAAGASDLVEFTCSYAYVIELCNMYPTSDWPACVVVSGHD